MLFVVPLTSWARLVVIHHLPWSLQAPGMLPITPGIRVFLPHFLYQWKIENDTKRELRRKFGIAGCGKRENWQQEIEAEGAF
jgi:hypothetical protein